MKELLVSLLLVTQFSCISKAQENDTTTQILTTDSLQTDTLLQVTSCSIKDKLTLHVLRQEATIIPAILNMSKTKSKVLTLP